MTKHERFLNVLANKPVDRVPVAFFHHFLEDWTDFGKGIEDDEVFEKNIEGHRIARKLFDPDVAKVMNDFPDAYAGGGILCKDSSRFKKN